MDLALKDKRAITTSDGKRIGRSISEALLQEAVSVAICVRDATTLADAAAARMGGLDVLMRSISAISAVFRVMLLVDGAATTSLQRQS